MELLQEYFDTALDTPDGIGKLRELILTLAMQGKLVKQDRNDQPASELLEEIRVEKERLISEGKPSTGLRAGIKRQKELTEIKEEEIPYAVPTTWEWAKLGNIGEINPRNIVDDNKEAGFVPMPLIFAGYGKTHSFKLSKWIDIKKGYTHFADGDVGLAKITPCFENGKSCIFENLPNGVGTGTTELHIFRNSFNALFPSFLLSYLKNPSYINNGKTKMTGSAGQKRVPTVYFAETPFPLPPLSEQKRIVKKIDQLMALCDDLEKLRNERNKKRLTVHTAAVNQLLSAEDSQSFASSWSFITGNFNSIYSVKENVAELKKVILQLAMIGKLVEQDPDDQSASELLEEIKAEKEKLIGEGLLKIGNKTKETKSINQNVIIPKMWEWVKGDEIFFITKLAGFEYTKYFKLTDVGEIPVIRAQNVRPLKLKLNNLKYIDMATSQKLDRCALKRSALLVTFIGAGIGDVAIFNKKERWHLAPNVAKVEPFENCDKKLNLTFINYFLISNIGRAEIFKHLKSTAQPSISMGTIRDIDFPIPPIAEQKRIVGRIDELMILCDELEKQIWDATEKKTALLNAVVAGV